MVFGRLTKIYRWPLNVGSMVSEEAETPREPDPEVREVAIAPAVREALTWLQVDLVEVFKPRSSVMICSKIFGGGAHSVARSCVGW